MYKLAVDSVRVSGRDLSVDEQQHLLENPNYVNDD